MLNRYLNIFSAGLLLFSNPSAFGELSVTINSTKPEMPQVVPSVPKKEFQVPALPETHPSLGLGPMPIKADDTVEVMKRLQRAAREVRLLEVWSLDPAIESAEEKKKKSQPYPFHGFHSLGSKELKDSEQIHKLILRIMQAIADGPEETMECFEPRHGLRIYNEKGFIDVLLCYACLQGILYEDDREFSFSTAKDAEGDFDAILSKLGLKKAD